MEAQISVKQVVEEFLKQLEVSAVVSVTQDEEGAYRVHIKTEETGLLIGYHGRTLESMQVLLGVMVSRKIGSWVRVYVNVNDYREKREEALMYMAQRAAEQALSSGQPVSIPYLSAADRRIVHLTLSGDERVTTESEGEASNRTIYIKPKQDKQS